MFLYEGKSLFHAVIWEEHGVSLVKIYIINIFTNLKMYYVLLFKIYIQFL